MPPPRDNITGKTYLEHGKPVRVLARWADELAPAWAGTSVEWLPRSDGKPIRIRTMLSKKFQLTSLEAGDPAACTR
jgi:hypothetical protein